MTEVTIEPDPKKDHLLSNKQYDTLKSVVQKVLPAAGALYAGLAVFWGFPNGEEVVGSLALFATFGGALLGLSDRSYNKSESKYDGVINVTETESKKLFNIALNSDPEDLEGLDQVLFKINAPPSPSNQ